VGGNKYLIHNYPAQCTNWDGYPHHTFRFTKKSLCTPTLGAIKNSLYPTFTEAYNHAIGPPQFSSPIQGQLKAFLLFPTMVMETAGVVIGIPALISLTAKTYLAVNRRIEQYRNYDKDVECILTRVHIAEKIFELHIRKLLTETIGEENTELLLKPLDKDSPTNNDIGIQISNALGDYGQLLYDCIKRVHNVLEQMIEIELHEGPLDVCTETQSVVSLTVSRVSLVYRTAMPTPKCSTGATHLRQTI